MLPNLTIPVLNRYDLLQRCVDSIDYPVKHLLIIDNGQNYRGRIRTPDCVEKMTWLDMPSNFGVAASWNLGIKSFRHDPVWFFTSNDVQFESGALAVLHETATEGVLTLSESFPYFHTFGVGEDVVRRIGLFDENIYPAFEEDIEFLGRIKRAGITLVHAPVKVRHDNSSTIHSDLKYRDANIATHPMNSDYRQRKEAGLIPLTEPKWALDRWRRQDWR
jgi:GT2 family glycosyltransferase